MSLARLFPTTRLWCRLQPSRRLSTGPWTPPRRSHACCGALECPTFQRVRTIGTTRSRLTNSSVMSASSAGGRPLYLFNTASKLKELFTVRDSSTVNMYVCGVTVYDYSHIGHARVYVAFDTLFRVLCEAGHDVTYVRNFTDIDDKIIRRSNETGQPWTELTSRFIDAFHEDMAALNCLPPTLEPKASEHIPDIIDMIQKIIRNGQAYAVDGDVYFEVSTFPSYGKLSGRKQEDNRAGERVEIDQRKRGAADFALWKAGKPGEPTWDSPWGPGRPGWHIECSAMIKRAFSGKGELDIHGGGRDLIFPHHENEIAQSLAACACCSPHQIDLNPGPTQFSRYWVHNGFVNIESEKMSKSLGNFLTIRDILASVHPLALRWMLLGTHYRAPLTYSPASLDQANERVYYVFQTLVDTEGALPAYDEQKLASAKASRVTGGHDNGASAFLDEVHASLYDDLNTPAALAALSTPLRELNELLTTRRGRKAPNREKALRDRYTATRAALRLLGFERGEPSGVLEEMRSLALLRAGLTEADVQRAVDRRNAYRSAKDYAAADSVRSSLAAQGIHLMDGPGGQTFWRPAA